MSNELFFYLVSGLLLGLFGASIAESKGRRRIDGFGLGFLLSIFGVLICAVLPTIAPATAEARRANGLKRCPDCAENVRIEALTCRFCRHAFDPTQTEQNSVACAEETVRSKRANRNRLTAWGLSLIPGLAVLVVGPLLAAGTVVALSGLVLEIKTRMTTSGRSRLAVHGLSVLLVCGVPVVAGIEVALVAVFPPITIVEVAVLSGLGLAIATLAHGEINR